MKDDDLKELVEILKAQRAAIISADFPLLEKISEFLEIHLSQIDENTSQKSNMSEIATLSEKNILLIKSALEGLQAVKSKIVSFNNESREFSIYSIASRR